MGEAQMLAVIHIVLTNVVFAEYQLLLGHRNIPLTSGGRCHRPSGKGIAKAEEKKVEAEEEKKKSEAKIKESEERAKRKEEKKKEKKPRKPNLPRKTTKMIMFLE